MTQERYFDILPNFRYINPVQEGGKREQYVEVKNLLVNFLLRFLPSVFRYSYCSKKKKVLDYAIVI